MSFRDPYDESKVDQVIDSSLRQLSRQMYGTASRRLCLALMAKGIDPWKAEFLALRTATLWADWMEDMRGGHFGQR